MKLRDLDLGWLTVIAAGMFAHMNQACLAGFCGDPSIASVQVDLPFLLFILTVITFIADHSWYPRSLKRPHHLIVLFFHIMTALTISNLAVGFIWIPLQALLRKANSWMASWVYDNIVSHDKQHSSSNNLAWQEYFTNFLEQHGDSAVPAPLLHFSQDEVEVAHALLQWTDESMPYALSMVVALLMLGSRFFAAGFWDQLRQAFLTLQSSLRRRRGRILLLPGGSLARLRSLAPRYVLRKVDDSDEEAEGRGGGGGGVDDGGGGGGTTVAPSAATADRRSPTASQPLPLGVPPNA